MNTKVLITALVIVNVALLAFLAGRHQGASAAPAEQPLSVAAVSVPEPASEPAPAPVAAEVVE